MKESNPSAALPFATPLYVVIKPVGALCNLACHYCYYMEKSALTHAVKPEKMSVQLLELFTRQYIASQTSPYMQFTWHGGEPLLQPLEFYAKALRFQQKYGGKGLQIENCIQTNGTLLTDEWCEFFAKNNFLVGISLDGPAAFHDAYRVNKHGNSSFDRVMRGIDLLRKHRVEFNIMATVNAKNVESPLEFYRFFKQMDCQYLQFAPVVERIRNEQTSLKLALPDETEARLAPFSVNPRQWGRFLCSLFDEWIKEDVGTIFVQQFDAALANWMGVPPGVCVFNRTCGHAAVLESNGDLYACDHFVFPDYRMGNIRQQTLTEMMYHPRQKNFGTDKHEALPSRCKSCRWLFACNGECPKNRFAETPEGEPGLNYLCEGYQIFFEHIAPFMEYMKEELLNKRPPANVMNWARKQTL